MECFTSIESRDESTRVSRHHKHSIRSDSISQLILGLDPEILLQNFEEWGHNMHTCVSVT
jgi:hypothetical protein